MNKRLFIIVSGLLLIPGCGLKQKKSTPVEVSTQDTGYKQKGKTGIYDEDVDAFVLEEDQNPFTTPSNKKAAADDALWSPEQREGDFETIYYDYDSDEIRPDQQSALDRNVQEIKAHTKKGKTVIVEGHACTSGGSDSYNMHLSEKRARSVKKHLTSKGVAKDKLKVVGRGSEMRKVTGGNKEQQAPNRRVESYVLEQE